MQNKMKVKNKKKHFLTSASISGMALDTPTDAFLNISGI